MRPIQESQNRSAQTYSCELRNSQQGGEKKPVQLSSTTTTKKRGASSISIHSCYAFCVCINIQPLELYLFSSIQLVTVDCQTVRVDPFIRCHNLHDNSVTGTAQNVLNHFSYIQVAIVSVDRFIKWSLCYNCVDYVTRKQMAMRPSDKQQQAKLNRINAPHLDQVCNYNCE